jgi:hypothetical protein
MAKPETASVLHIVVAAALAIALLVVGATVADKFDLPLIHGWALAHGAIFIVLPAYFLLSYFALLPVAKRLQTLSASVALPKRVSFLAVASLLLSVGGFVIPLVGSLLGITAGHAARRRCKGNPQLSGSDIALAGLILGYLGLAYSVYVIGMVTWVASH